MHVDCCVVSGHCQAKSPALREPTLGLWEVGMNRDSHLSAVTRVRKGEVGGRDERAVPCKGFGGFSVEVTCE